jgi:hypothetical protein
LQMTWFCSSLWLNKLTLCIYATFSLSIHLLMDTFIFLKYHWVFFYDFPAWTLTIMISVSKYYFLSYFLTLQPILKFLSSTDSCPHRIKEQCLQLTFVLGSSSQGE